MIDPTQNTAMLWTGGKDSAMALHEAMESGYRIRCLVTFAPPNPDFLAHPLRLIQLQAQALALPHHILPITAPFDKSYEAGLRRLRDEMDIGCVVTVDIAEVDSNPNWIRERSRPVGLSVHTPLWGRDRNTLLQQLLDRGFQARFSCVNTRWLNEDWVGRALDATAIDELRSIREQTGLDLCGEEGEYHTMVVDGPCFTCGIDIRSYSKRVSDSLAYMDIHEMGLRDL
ncbi:MAG: diphthine--ammonia ligase [Gammaproteobacteria bacterium]|nr:diphthine--ammonia ligase [Gammaproteobacteria bacterium]